MAFQGSHDWEPDVAPDSPVRDTVKALRQSTGSFSIVLCTSCVIRQAGTPAPQPDTQLQLFDV